MGKHLSETLKIMEIVDGLISMIYGIKEVSMKGIMN